MNAKKIDELLEALIEAEESDLEKIIKLADIEIIDENVENFITENEEKILERLMTKIEQGDYDYFYSKIEEERYKDLCISLLCFSSKVEDIKEIIERREELELNKYDLTRLISATKDSEYIKGILENEEKIEELGLDKNNLVQLILTTKDSEYIKGIIEKIEELELNKYSLIQLISAIEDSEYIKGILEDSEKIEELGLEDADDLIQLILATRDTEYIKGILEDREKREGLGLEDANDLVSNRRLRIHKRNIRR